MERIRRFRLWWKWTHARYLVWRFRRSGRVAYLRNALSMKHRSLVMCEKVNQDLHAALNDHRRNSLVALAEQAAELERVKGELRMEKRNCAAYAKLCLPMALATRN